MPEVSQTEEAGVNIGLSAFVYAARMNLVSIFNRHDPHLRELELNLLELGLDTRKLGSAAVRGVRQERTRLLKDARIAPSLLAIRLFVWYLTESKMFDPGVLIRPGAIGISISTIRRWVAEDPVIAAVAETEIFSIKLFLYQVFETVEVAPETIARAQERLLDA